MAEQQYNHNDIMNKLDFIHRDLGALNERTADTNKHVTSLEDRTRQIEQKFFVLQCVWGAIIGVTGFAVAKLKDII